MAPPFLATRKGEKNRQGAFPPEPPGGFVDFLSMKIDSDAPPEPAYIKRGYGPRGWGCCIFSVLRPTDPRGLGPPCCINADSRKNGNAGFPGKENRPISWGPGGKAPGVSLRPFSTRRKDVAAHSIPFSVKSRSFCADDPPYPFFLVWPAGHPLSWRQERGKRTVRGLCRFSLYENRLEPYCQNQPI